RQTARSIIGDRFTEVWLRCPVEVCRQCDPKGLYKGSNALRGSQLTGVDDPFEEPLNPDLIVDTATESVPEETWKILEHLAQRGFARRIPAACGGTAAPRLGAPEVPAVPPKPTGGAVGQR